MSYSRSSVAIERIGYLFSSTNDFYLRMYILHKKKFLDRVYALQSLISKTPSSAGAHYTICQRTYRILEAHAHGLTFLTLDRARLLRDGDEIAVDWHYVEQDYLSVADIKKWAIAAGHIASNVRSVNSKINPKPELMFYLGNSTYLHCLSGTSNLAQFTWKIK